MKHNQRSHVFCKCSWPRILIITKAPFRDITVPTFRTDKFSIRFFHFPEFFSTFYLKVLFNKYSSFKKHRKKLFQHFVQNSFPICSKFPDFSITGKCSPIFPSRCGNHICNFKCAINTSVQLAVQFKMQGNVNMKKMVLSIYQRWSTPCKNRMQ